MKEPDENEQRSIKLASERVAEVDRLMLSVRKTLEEMIAALQAGKTTDAKAILSKVKEFQAVHLQLIASEDSYHAKLGVDPDEDAIDYDELRREIGRRLDRIRESRSSE